MHVSMDLFWGTRVTASAILHARAKEVALGDEATMLQHPRFQTLERKRKCKL